eukprot:scaffold118689_cov75-Phaeocystis_antarctica.AAC.2
MSSLPTLARLRFAATSQRHRAPRPTWQPGSGGSSCPPAAACSEAIGGATPSWEEIGEVAMSPLEPRGVLRPWKYSALEAPVPPPASSSPTWLPASPMRRSKPNATFPLNERGVLRPPPPAASPVSRSKPNANPLRWKDETGEASVVGGDPGGVASAIEGDLERSRSFSKRSSKDNTEGTSLSQATSPMQEIGDVAISPLKPRGASAPPAPPARRSKPNAIFSLDERGVLRPPLAGPAAAGGLFTTASSTSYSVAIFGAPIPNSEKPWPPPPNIAMRL